MDKATFSYAGVGASVAGVIGILGIYSGWWETDFATYNGTADISGQLALGMAIGLFAFGGAYVLISDARIRRAMGALATLCAVVLTLSCVWALTRSESVAPFAEISMGLYVSTLGGILGIAAGFLVMRDTAQMEAAGSPDDQPSSSEAGAAI
ncbi:MAG TPA: hypothetical protein VJM84_01680 [Actinomycetota bacterium]|nr:hypothetical protein [Actinomycetota bacterium]